MTQSSPATDVKQAEHRPVPSPDPAALGADHYRRQLETVANNATLALFIMDEHQQCTYMNPAAERLTGYTLAEVQGRALHDVIHHTYPDGRPFPIEECAIDRAFPENMREQGEEVFVHRDGFFYPVAFTASPIREGDRTVGTIIEVRDIRREKEFQRQREELDRAKAAFFSNVSHEFRTPLTLIAAPAEEALADPSLPGVERQRWELVQRNGVRLQRLVNTLLDFSRIEAGRVQATFEPLDLAAFTRDLASLFRSAVERAGLRFVVETPPLPQPVYVDREMWEKVVMNLLSNALKFTFQGEIALRLHWCDGGAELQVRDTGVGIPAAELPHVFDRFHRVKGARSRTHEGTGIGLALVRELVALHGGEIQAHSTEGEGTKFTVRLPAGSQHLPARHVVNTAQPLPATGPGAGVFVDEALRWLPQAQPAEAQPAAWHGHGAADAGLEPNAPGSPAEARVLLADDNRDMREYLTRILSVQWQVEAVPNGAAALAAAQRDPPDLVLSDVMMPELDGVGLLHALRQDPRTRDVPVILLSARAGEDARVEGIRSGADDYLVKPFSVRELAARVGGQIELSRMRRETAQRERELRHDAERARADADAANRAKSDFLATMSHELRTPLNAMIGYTDLLEMGIGGELPPASRHSVERIGLAARHLLQIIEEILTFSRMEAGREEVELSDVNLPELMREVQAIIEPLAEARGLRFRTQTGQAPSTLRTDARKLRQVLVNLLGNAVKFTEIGEVELSVGPDVGGLAFRVRDTGIGIASEDLDRLWEPFWQADATTRRTAGGTGLGLTVSQRLAHLLGGRIEVSSTPGRGSEFTLYLPWNGAQP